MAQNLCVKIEHPEVIKAFRNLVIQKHGQYIGYFGREVEAAMSHWIELNADLLSKKNNSNDSYNSDEQLRDMDIIKLEHDKPQRKLKENRSKHDALQMTLEENIKTGNPIERSVLINLITSAGYGRRYAEKEIAPAIIRQYNLDVQEDGMVKVHLKNLDRYEWILKEDRDFINSLTQASFLSEY